MLLEIWAFVFSAQNIEETYKQPTQQNKQIKKKLKTLEYKDKWIYG